ncbi:SRPBCC family protein [soil metagenome]
MDTATTTVAAPPGRVYGLVADVTNMGRWSPECYRCAWLDGAHEPAVGARFKGWNRQQLGPVPLQCSTVSTVTVATPGQAFAFVTKQSGATWTYRMEDAGDGTTRLTETREDGDKPLVARMFAKVVPNRDELLRHGMQKSVERIKAAAEGA